MAWVMLVKVRREWFLESLWRLWAMKVNFKGKVMAFLLVGLFVFPSLANPDESRKLDLPDGIYLELTKEFYEALKLGARVYSNDPSQEYLRQISISSKFVVETNLRILEQQERIVKKLDQILRQLQNK